MSPLYDSIGKGYRRFRRPDPRIAAQVELALGDATSVCNVGAGAGSYEPRDRRVVAVEISAEMIAQRSSGAQPAVRASAMALPFEDRTFDAALALLTLHHWSQPRRGLAEMRRVARRRAVLLTWDPEFPGFWLTDYFPEILDHDRAIFPSRDQIESALGPVQWVPVPIPSDCSDGFLGAYWQRPEVYLDAERRRAISTFSRIQRLDEGLRRLEDDLASGAWQQRHATSVSSADLGYRLVVSRFES